MARRGRPAKQLVISPDTRVELESLAGSRSLPSGLVRRAKIVLLCTEGWTREAVAKEISITPQTVGKWREAVSTPGTIGAL